MKSSSCLIFDLPSAVFELIIQHRCAAELCFFFFAVSFFTMQHPIDEIIQNSHDAREYFMMIVNLRGGPVFRADGVRLKRRSFFCPSLSLSLSPFLMICRGILMCLSKFDVKFKNISENLYTLPAVSSHSKPGHPARV